MRRPPLVDRATGTGSDAGTGTGRRDVDEGLGELLHVLAAGRGVRRAASTAGDPAAAAWIASALAPGTPLYVAGTEALTNLFADDPDIHVLGSEWADSLPAEAPFDLVHVGEAAASAVDAVLALAAPRATLVVPHHGTGTPPHAGAWLAHARVDATVLTIANASVIVAVVRG